MGILRFLRGKLRPAVFAVSLAVAACATKPHMKRNHFPLGQLSPTTVLIEGDRSLQGERHLDGHISGSGAVEIAQEVINSLEKGEKLPVYITIIVHAFSTTSGFDLASTSKKIVLKLETREILDYIKKRMGGNVSGREKKVQLQLFMTNMILRATADELQKIGITK